MASPSSPPHRRQPPLPLVFSPEIGPSPPTVLFSNAAAPPPLSISGSNQNTVSMPFVRRHVTRRLKAAKSECDKELHRITNNITTFFEERLRESQEQEVEREIFELERDRARESPGIVPDSERDPFSPGNWLPDQSALQTDDSSDGGYEPEGDFNRHGRQRALPEANSAPVLTHKSSSPGLGAASNQSLSPASLRRSHPVPWDPKPMNSSPSSSAGSSMVLPDAPITRLRVDQSPSTGAPRTNPGLPSRRLSRSIHVPARATRSGQSSRSTSRSRSPLPPPSSHASFSEPFAHPHPTPPPTSSASNRRSSRVLLDDPIDPIMTALYDLIAVATDITEMTINQLTAQPKICETFVQRIQNIGKAWDRHPNWHGRNWYVQVLLAVASLSRVVEWWEAEKQFWNFDDNEEEQDEPLAFVTKQTDEISLRDEPESGSGDEESKQRISRTVSQNRKHREDTPAAKAHTAPPSPTKEHPDFASRANSSKFLPNTESARVLATERLRLQAETAQNQNTVVELSLDGDHIIWVNYAWSVVVGSDADEIPGSRMSYYLHPTDINVLRDASEKLQEEDQKSKTIQVRFKLQIVPDDDRDLPPGGALYQKMEGNGMLMIDRDDGMPSHTMWVVKPIASPKFEPYPSPMVGTPGSGSIGASTTDLNQLESLPFPQPISVEPILCRICECQIPQWYFEKHSETCVELHRMEAEIAECNESISELRSSIRALAAKMDSPSPGSTPVYRGMPILSPSSSPGPSSPLHLFKFGKMQKFGLKKMQRRLLDQLDDILQVALEVSIPSLKEDESKEPIERQRLLSPGSERKMTQIRNWSKPAVEDSALNQLVEDTERIMRQKIDNVIRMQNTMRYSEKIWCEWREKVEETLDLDSDSYSGSDEEQVITTNVEPMAFGETLSPPLIGEDDHSSTTSEYGFVGEHGRSCDPTPMAPSPAPPADSRPQSAIGHEHRSSSSGAISARGMQYTRSSTPSSISSPLAYAAPIVAPSSPEDIPPPMSLDDDSHMRSHSNPEHKVFVTPPISPMLTAKDVPTVTRENSLGRRHSRRHSVNPLSIGTPGGSNPLSPRQSAAPLSRSTPTSIKDFDIIKPISKGAFGSVFLAKKKVTGDYYAIKVLKKADMISKNQITNVKAERMILMKQAESPFVAKLYFTFQSKENLYLVMEYLNGGDCAALIKSLGSLPEEWTRQYIAEVTLGLEYLHERGIVHRDLKPDNLLIDSHGHLKLTDFGLSRIGLLGRQSRDMNPRRQQFRSRPPSLDSAYMSSPLLHDGGSYFSHRTGSAPRVANGPHLLSTDDFESNGSDSVAGWQGLRGTKPSDSPLQSFASELANDLRSHNDLAATQEGNTPPGEQKFVGTPDYLAPETILGLRGDDASVDWWALGVITYEFLYGIPPFHADSPEKVFENILSGRIDWHEDWVEFSYAARDFMERLMTISVPRRLGANGADEVREHAFFESTEWDQVTTTEAAFIPQVTDPESTDYFDPRGAIPQLFHDDDDHIAITNRALDSPSAEINTNSAPAAPVAIAGHKDHTSSAASSDDFGSFSFKNIPVLKQANDDVIRKLKTDQMAPLTQTLSEPMGSLHQRKRSMSTRIKKPPSVVTSMEGTKPFSTGPPSPATSTSSVASSPSRGSIPPSTPGSATSHSRKPSELGAVERFKANHMDQDRRNSLPSPSRLRTASVSSTGDGSGSEAWGSSVGHGSNQHETPSSSVLSIDLRKGPDLNDRVVTCLLAEDNPITAKIIETLLIRLGCRCVVVADGSEAISVAMGDIKFDCILMDLQMPVLDGESAAKYIRNTNGKNSSTPIISVSAYSAEGFEANSIFAAALSKPLQKADLLAAMQKLGFKTSTVQGPRASRITTARVAS